MATYFDPKSWSPLRAVDLGKRLLDQSWLEQWVTLTTAWVDPVADLGSGTVTALMPDMLMTVLSEGILSRFGGQEVGATLLGHEVQATLQVLKVRRRGAHFQTKTVLSRMRWNTHDIETVTVIAHGVRLIPGVPTKVRASGIDIEGTLTVTALIDWLNRQGLDWELLVAPDGRILARHRRRKLTAHVEADIVDNLLRVDIGRASWLGLRIPRRFVTAPDLVLERLPHGARVTSAAREGDLIRFRAELPEMTGSFDLAQIRSAIVTGTALIIF
ncbi:hypothetical protein ACTD5D_02705 [Nocardia takedensis]|uniref:hypothetical protein n=1 Tax=Nocardia takedensis TaxID=259390 RepID=UPI00031C9B3C|nr:hypothetical protein [Nocardia takedensis]